MSNTRRFAKNKYSPLGGLVRVVVAIGASYALGAVYGFSIIPESASEHDFNSAMGMYLILAMAAGGALAVANEVRIYSKPR